MPDLHPSGDALLRGDCRAILRELPESSVQLIVTSPPYNVGWSYADDGRGDRRPLPDYLQLLESTFAGLHRVLRPGGVLALNLPPSIRLLADDGSVQHPAWPVSAWAQLHLLEAGWLLRGPLAWVKMTSTGKAYASSPGVGHPRNPYLRPAYEHVILASKDAYFMPGAASGWEAAWGGFAGESYLEWTKDVWLLPAGRARKGQPLRFPDLLVRWLVRWFSVRGDVVLDPFAGTGQVGRTAREEGRVAWLIEREPSYWDEIERALGMGAAPPERSAAAALPDRHPA